MTFRISPLPIATLTLSLTLTGCVIDPNAFPSYPPPSGDNGSNDRQEQPSPKRALVKTIGYAKGDISYFMTSNSTAVSPGKVRICLENNTGQPKKMRWTRIQSGVNDLNAPKNGSTSCATLSLSQRIEWDFLDRGIRVKSDGMNLASFSGRLVEFIWVRDY